MIVGGDEQEDRKEMLGETAIYQAREVQPLLTKSTRSLLGGMTIALVAASLDIAKSTYGMEEISQSGCMHSSRRSAREAHSCHSNWTSVL